MTAYTIAARANATLLAAEAGSPARSRLTDALFERLGWGAGSAGKVAEDAPRTVEYAYERHDARGSL
ncbi:MAG TPA: hypothetical protein IAC28_02625 [Candidatus Aphodovivens excrementavium]|nr:hypothetical protein [Candidatus Aphodovivens excrementavium]